MPFVLDTSVTLVWYLTDEASEYADMILGRLSQDSAIVPGLWPVEVANGLLVAERRRRITQADAARITELLSSKPISVVPTSLHDALDEVLPIARDQNLTAYDAAYLHLAMREGVSLATLDTDLRDAAARVGVELTDSLPDQL